MSAVAQNHRTAAAARFDTLGWPSARSESWRYFKVRELRSAGYVPVSQEASEQVDSIVATLPELVGASHRVVVVNGRLVGNVEAAAGVHIGQLQEDAGHFEAVDTHLADAPMAALNTQHFDGGLRIVASANSVCEAPIEVVFVTTGAGVAMTSPRVHIVAERQSQLDLTFRFLTHQTETTLTNALVHVQASDGARVRTTTLCDEGNGDDGGGATHVHTVLAEVGRDSHYGSHVVMRSGIAARSEIRVRLADQGANCDLRGLYVATGKQVHDNYSVIEHLAPHTTSNEFYRGIIEDEATGTFQGRVLIAVGATRSEAHQLNNNLLLGRGAVVNTKPQLEIDNDDVTASHGSTVGQLDEDALFYLQSRGIAYERARGLLTYSFAKEALDGMPSEALATQLAHSLEAQLAGATDHASWPKDL